MFCHDKFLLQYDTFIVSLIDGMKSSHFDLYYLYSNTSQGTLRYRDSRPRIRKKEGGVKERLMIRRFRCQNCRTYHNELPDCLVPYKHYEAEVIAGVLDEVRRTF